MSKKNDPYHDPFEDDLDLSVPASSEASSEAVVDGASLSAELLAAMVSNKDALLSVHETGLNPKLLGDDLAEEAFRDLLAFYAKHNKPMALKRFLERHPNVSLAAEYREDITDLLLDIVTAAKQRHIAGFRLAIDNEIDPERGGNHNKDENLERIYVSARDLLKEHALWFTPAADRLQTFGDGTDILERYAMIGAGTQPGIRVPGALFKELIEDIGPLGPGHLTGLFARPGVKKTWVLVLMACMVAANGKNVFIWSSEMEPIELKERSIAMLAQLNFTRFTRGRLDEHEQKRLKDFLQSVTIKALNEHLFIAGPTAMSRVEDLEIYCSDNKIAMVCLDNVHTMESRGEEHVKINNLMFDLKYMAIRRKLPLVYTTHQNRYGGSNMEGVAYGDAFNTWSSNMINLKRMDDRTVQTSTIKVRSGIGNRQYTWTIDLDKAEFKSIRMQKSNLDVVDQPRQGGILNEGL